MRICRRKKYAQKWIDIDNVLLAELSHIAETVPVGFQLSFEEEDVV